MALDRGALAKIDRRVLSELNHGPGMQLVKVPLADAVWSTWRRYCEAVGLTMGEAIAGLINCELRTVVDEAAGGDGQVFAARAEEQLVRRESQVGAREHELDVVEKRLRAWTGRLRIWQGELEVSAARVQLASRLTAQPTQPIAKVGRNERCPCGSRLKYKHCHGF